MLSLLWLILFLQIQSLNGFKRLFCWHADPSTRSTRTRCRSSSVPSISINDNIKPEHYVVHTGRSADMIKRSPALSGITLCKGWSPSATDAFRRAVQACVTKNPILSGHVYEKHKKELWIQTGTFSPESHEYCKLLQPPSITGPSLSSMAKDDNDSQILNELMTRYLDLFDSSELTSEQINKRLPLFAASLMVENDVALFSMKLSHAVGDGVTFFEILKQVSLLMSNDGHDSPTIPCIEWNHPLKPTHEFYPPNFSDCDIEISYGTPFLLGCVKNVVTQYGRRKPSVFLIDKNKISTLKRKFREDAKGNDYSAAATATATAPVSSNDVITSGLCQANVGADLFVFTENVRALVDDIPRNAGGNFLWEIPVRREVCVQPERLRGFIQAQQQQYQHMDDKQTQQLPWRPFLCGTVARVTSLASITESIVYKDVKTIFHSPLNSTDRPCTKPDLVPCQPLVGVSQCLLG
ncbi:hypothetical protein IV203_021867 [Nitzschia inconspicua]|uniref:Uncharacterized protein n=1 Tax=Nitzschia inconspicua TaxID=303405 RepID=A0A9K3PGB2_9STRA|nr:hypothetical protein IV203_021867 [Nitzschia inconspicua]